MADPAVSELLCIVVDVNPLYWESMSKSPNLEGYDSPIVKFLETTIVFINSFLAMDPKNVVTVIGSGLGVARFLYPDGPGTGFNSRKAENRDSMQVDGSSKFVSISKAPSGVSEGQYEVLAAVNDVLHRNFRAMAATMLERSLAQQERERQIEKMQTNADGVNGIEDSGPPPDVGVSKAKGSIGSALGMALCYINRYLKGLDPGDEVRPSILVLKVSPDSPVDHLGIMNAVFAAQKYHIPVSCVALNKRGNASMQQAAYLSHGSFRHVNDIDSLFVYLMSEYLVGTQARGLVLKHGSGDIDYRTVCFCHEEVCDVAYVCPVCLSVFCQRDKPRWICSTCKTRFKRTKQQTDAEVALKQLSAP
eukprot:Clim_evm5s242 gene=Clim_evmTU5s242